MSPWSAAALLPLCPQQPAAEVKLITMLLISYEPQAYFHARPTAGCGTESGSRAAAVQNYF